MNNLEKSEKNPEKIVEVIEESLLKKAWNYWIKDILIFVALVVFVVLPIKAYIAKPFVVSGDSMYPNIKNGDYLIVDQVTPKLKGLKRGDVVVFKYPNNPSEFFIKRVIGLPGETITINGQVVTVKSGDKKFSLSEPFIELQGNNQQTQTLGENEYWVMGDNRLQSKDSRSWGPLDKSFVIGTPIVRLFPLNKIDILPAKIEY